MHMEKEQLYKCLKQPESLSGVTVDELGRVIEEFPFFQTVRLLYTQKLHAIGDTRYMNELGKAAIFCADRSKLFYLIHAERYKRLLNLPGGDTLSEKDRTEILLDSYLQSFEEKGKPGEMPSAIIGEEHVARSTTSLTWRRWAKGCPWKARQHRLQHQDIIDAFIEKANNDDIALLCRTK